MSLIKRIDTDEDRIYIFEKDLNEQEFNSFKELDKKATVILDNNIQAKLQLVDYGSYFYIDNDIKAIHHDFKIAKMVDYWNDIYFEIAVFVNPDDKNDVHRIDVNMNRALAGDEDFSFDFVSKFLTIHLDLIDLNKSYYNTTSYDTAFNKPFKKIKDLDGFANLILRQYNRILRDYDSSDFKNFQYLFVKLFSSEIDYIVDYFDTVK
ncbi:hypothetical protein [Mycoplasmopsis adleri]|uniref:hypothetical protein n=1 Tax=Mycoplasmopsis adleri TaxID=51362 RepID=UPI0038738802